LLLGEAAASLDGIIGRFSGPAAPTRDGGQLQPGLSCFSRKPQKLAAWADAGGDDQPARPGLLELFDRIVLIDNGRITPDGPKDRVLAVSLGEIAPPEKKLPIEACMSPRDIAFIPDGRPLTVKITAYDPSICGTRAGTL
jgi:hypothetical protein